MIVAWRYLKTPAISCRNGSKAFQILTARPKLDIVCGMNARTLLILFIVLIMFGSFGGGYYGGFGGYGYGGGGLLFLLLVLILCGVL